MTDIIRPTVAPATAWPRVLRGPWAPIFHARRGDTLHRNPIVWALYIDGELVRGWEWPDPQRRNIDGRGTHEWTPRAIDPRDWPAGAHDVRVAVFAHEPEPNPVRTYAIASATVTFEHDAPPRFEAPVGNPRVGSRVPNVGPFFVAPFYHSVHESIADSKRRDAYFAAQLYTHTESVHAPLGPLGYEAAMRELRQRTAGMREHFTANPRADVVLIWDNLTQFERDQTIANPDTRRIIEEALAHWHEITGGRVRWLRILDEAAMKWGHPIPPFIRQATDWLRGPCARLGIPLAWSGGGGVPAHVNADYARLTGAFDLYALHGQDDGLGRIDGYTLPRIRFSHDVAWRGSLEAIDADVPLVGLVSAASWQYTKGDSDQTRGYYDPAIDFAHAPSGRALATSLSAALKILDGACGVSVYFDDDAGTLALRRRETFPRSVLPEPCQTGCSPFAPRGETRDMWHAMGAVQRFTNRLGMRLFDVMDHPDVDLPPGVRASRRGSDLTLWANTREVPAVVQSPVPGSGSKLLRLRLQGARYWTEAYEAGSALALRAGECSALIPSE